MDTTTTYLGLRLQHPFMAGASPMSAHLDGVRRLEDAGASAIVLHSLFEEQITEAATGRIHGIDRHEDPAVSLRVDMFPPLDDYPFEPEDHLEHVRRVKAAVRIPVIASLNGSGPGAWLRHAVLLEYAGADALEVNFYQVVTDLTITAAEVEGRIVRAIEELKDKVRIPVAAKLSPYFSAVANMAARLDHAGVDGLVLFNRFYQPDINIQFRTATPSLRLSTSDELRLRLRWLAILHGRIRPSLAVTGGVEDWRDGVKAVLAGAHAVQMVSALLRHGPSYLGSVVKHTATWMEQNQVASMDALRGQVSLLTSPHAANFERANYIRTLHHWEE